MDMPPKKPTQGCLFCTRRGIYFIFVAYCSFLSLLASWLFGFSASWLLGFSASWLLAFWLLGFFLLLVGLRGFWWLWLFASSAFPVPLRQVAFWLLRLCAGLCGFWKLWLFASSAFPVPLRAFWLLHWFLDLASRIISITSSSLFESLLLRTSWEGAAPTPQPPRYPM